MEEAKEFLKRYETATNSHDFDKVAPLLANDAVYWFSDGSLKGVAAIREAFEKTWNIVRDEAYKIVNISWVLASPTNAVCIYEFQWQGKVDGIQKSGKGRGTNVMSKGSAGWQMLHEHLSKYPPS
jgi:ketosteroid isomerase-like protein